jgi:hypothetical protein
MDHEEHAHGTADDHGPHRLESLNRTAASATLHCLTGCAIGEVLGMVIGTAFALGNITTVVLSILLAFLFGYSLTTLPLLRSGLAVAVVVPLAFASDTFSITVMEVVDNVVMIWLPGAMDANLGDLLFWGALALSLVTAFFAAWPVNRYLIARGRGHAVVHGFHHGGPADAATVPALNVKRLAVIGIAAVSFTVGVGVAGAALAERTGSSEKSHGSLGSAPTTSSPSRQPG